MSNDLEVNQFSELWYRTFMDTIDPAQSAAEVAFLERQLPQPRYARILDLCCGAGRHALPLAARGYQVTGVDRDAAVIARARAPGASRATFVQADVRRTGDLGSGWDGVIIMWASFGYFEPEENLDLLAKIRRWLAADGRVVLDIYNHDFFAERQGELRRERAGQEIVERKQIVGDRLFVELRYAGSDVVDRFSWQIFRPQELLSVAKLLGFEPLRLCTQFDESSPVTAAQGRMQVVLQRGSE